MFISIIVLQYIYYDIYYQEEILMGKLNKGVYTGITVIVVIITLLSLWNELMPHVQDAGDSMDYDSLCEDNLGSSGLCGQWDPGSDYDDFDCDQNYDGGMTQAGEWIDWVNTVDMDWDTYGTCNDSQCCYTTFSYYIPNDMTADDAKWEKKDGDSRANLSLTFYPIVVNATHHYIKLRVDTCMNDSVTNWSEYINATDYELLRSESTNEVYDQYLWWIQDPEACYMGECEHVGGLPTPCCLDSGWNNLTDECAGGEVDNIPMGGVISTIGLLLLMILLLIMVIKWAFNKGQK